MMQPTKEQGFVPHRLEWTEDVIRRFWDGLASMAEYAGQYFSRDAGQVVLNLCSTYAPCDGSILDLGSGPGYLVEMLLKQKNVSCAAYDWSPEAVRILNERFAGVTGWKGAFGPSGGRMPFCDSLFDVIFCLETLEHILPAFLPDTIADMRRVLKPSGIVFVSVPGNEDLARNTVMCPECGCVFHRHQHVRSFDKHELRHLMEANGFDTVFCDLLPLWSFKNEARASLTDISIRKILKILLLVASQAADRFGLRRANPRRLLVSLLRGRGDNLVWIGRKPG